MLYKYEKNVWKKNGDDFYQWLIVMVCKDCKNLWLFFIVLNNQG